jgi:hypothetical protein
LTTPQVEAGVFELDLPRAAAIDRRQESDRMLMHPLPGVADKDPTMVRVYEPDERPEQSMSDVPQRHRIARLPGCPPIVGGPSDEALPLPGLGGA